MIYRIDVVVQGGVTQCGILRSRGKFVFSVCSNVSLALCRTFDFRCGCRTVFFRTWIEVLSATAGPGRAVKYCEASGWGVKG